MKGHAMTFVGSVIDSIEWSSMPVLKGTGADLKDALAAFVVGPESEMEKLWWGLEGAAFAQNTIYASAAPTVDVMMAALADGQPDFRRGWILEVLRFILAGESAHDQTLAAQCRARAERGLWLLAAETRRVEGEVTVQAVREVLELIDPSFLRRHHG
jgi:hypothetical protein